MSGRAAGEGGFSLLEVTVAVALLSVVLLGLVGAVLLAGRRSTQTGEMALAQSAARRKIEEIQGQDFRDLGALYNSDPADDPAGSGTAPGATFTVTGLLPRQGASATGFVILPPQIGSSPSYTYYESPPSGVVTTMTADLGFPMDLNGDGDVNDQVGVSRVIRCPVKVRIEWRGPAGEASFDLCTVVIRR